MHKSNEPIITEKVSSSRKWSVITTLVKTALAIAVCIAYLANSSWLNELIVVSVVISLVLPLGFHGAFIESLNEYNTQTLESRQLLNANEANGHFTRMNERIEMLEDIVC